MTTARQAPKSPPQLAGGSWLAALKRTGTGFQARNLTDWAAALTYYGVLSIFPAIIALVSILGLIGRSATQPLLNNLNAVAPGPAKQIFTGAVNGLQHSKGAAGALFVIGIASAIWSASGYVGGFMRASNSIYEVEEGRPIWIKRPLQVAVTVAMMFMLSVSAIAVVFTGGLAKQVGHLIGVGSSAVQVWDIAKWPVLLIVVALMFSVLYWAAPNVRQPGFRWLTPGGLFAVIVWIIASAAFGAYVANFGSYNKTYGTLGAVIGFLVWLWISNLAVLLGALINAELERGRELEGGQHEAERELQVEPRDTRKMKSS